MKKSIKLTIVFTLAVMLCVLFAIFASAETYSVQYKNMNWDGNRDKKSTDENGVITLRDTGYTTDTGSYEITGPEGDKISVQRQFYGWYDEQGNFYEKGATITLTSNLVLREAFGFEVYTFEDLNTYLGNFFWYTRLGADIVANSTIFTQRTGNGNMVTLDLNGHKITSTAQYAFEGQRCGFIITGEGTINHTYTGTAGGLWNSTVHGYGEGQQRLWIGKDVTINTTGALLHSTSNWPATADPLLRIYGKTTSAYLSNTLSTPSNKKFEIYEGAEVTVTGDALIKNRSTATALQTTLHIYGGKLDFPNNIDYYGDIARIRYEITGGSFVNKLPNDFLKNGNDCVYNDETGLYEVMYVACTAEGSNGEHAFKVQEAFNDMSATCDAPGFHYYRCACGSAYVDEVAALGHSYTAITIEKIATTTENGVKRVTCENCDDSYTYEYSFDPRDQVVTIVVKTEDGTKEITATVGDIYNVEITETIDGFASKFNGISTIVDPDNSEVTYSISSIVKLVIPAGITDIATGSIKNATALEEIVLLDGANATFASKSIDGCTALKSIVLGDCSVTFSSNTINGNTADLTIDATNANVTTLASAFEGRATLKHFVMGTRKSYNFAANTFKTAGIEEFVVPDYAILTAAYATCYQANSLKYVYIGRGITQIDNIFDQCFYMQTIVLMDVTSITGQYFACLANKGEDVLRIYHHADTLSTAGRFLHQSHGVILYTNATGWKGSMDACSAITKTIDGTEVSYPSYTIVKGIPHQYIEGGIDATCTTMGSTGYTTDCPCGVVADATYTTYSGVNAGTAVNGTTVVEGSIAVGITTNALGHEFDEADGATVVSTTPANCIKDATITYKCARCDETLTVVQEGTVTGHNTEGVEWEIAVQVTCAADGFKQKICKVCNTIAEGEIIPAIGHAPSGQWETTVEATCTVGATRIQYCKNEGCDFIALSETTDPNGHTPSEEWVVDVAPTCEKTGVKYQRCTVCNAICESIVLDSLGHEFDVADGATLVGIAYENGFNQPGAISTKCARCDSTNDTAVAPLFGAKGYSTNSTHTALNGGFTLNTEILPLYERFNGEITYGIIIANANSFGESSFVDADNKVNSAKAMQVPITTKNYSNFDCSLDGFGLNSGTLELIITAYVIDAEGNISFIQAENDYAIETTVGEQTFTKVTLDLVVANVTEQPDAILPDEE